MARSRYTIAISELICSELSTGKPLRQICRDHSIAWPTVYDWRDAHPDFATRFALARERGEDALAAECLEIADTPMEGVETTEEATLITTDSAEDAPQIVTPATTVKTKRGDMLGHRKLQIETRLKLLAKWNPSKWGDKVEQTHKGDGTTPLMISISPTDAKL